MEHLGYVLPGVGAYFLTAPTFSVLFPFVHLVAPRLASPVGLGASEPTGGMLVMAPIVVCAAFLPVMWWRRTGLPTRIVGALLVLVAAGLVIPVLPSFDFFSSTERYEVDFAGVLVLGGVSSWLAASSTAIGAAQRLLRIAGGTLVLWGCGAGFATAFYNGEPGEWSKLKQLGSPISTLATTGVGRPVLAEISIGATAHETTGDEGAGKPVAPFALSASEPAHITIVSPGAQQRSLVAIVEPHPAIQTALRVSGPQHTSRQYPLGPKGSQVSIPVQLRSGLNHLTLSPLPAQGQQVAHGTETMLVDGLSISSG
jgi:hypothetical protein